MRAGKLMGMGLAAFLLFCGASRAQDSLNVTKVGEIAYWIQTNHVAVSGNYAYLGDFSAGLRILNISDPINPVEVGYFYPPGRILSLALQGNYVYLSVENLGLMLVDVSDPSHPYQVGFCPAANAPDIAVQGNYAYLALYQYGMLVISISDPGAPQIVGGTTDSTHAVATSGNYAFTVSIANTLEAWDISNPSSISQVDWLVCPNSLSRLEIAGDHLYASTQDGLAIVNISNPTSMYLQGYCTTSQWGWDLSIGGNCAYLGTSNLTGSQNFLKIIDISSPAIPIIIGSVLLPDRPSGVALNEPYVFIADRYKGIRVIDVALPSQPVEIAFLDTPDGMFDFALQGNYIYSAALYSGLRIIDISNPYAPMEVGFCDSSIFAWYIAVKENYAYLAEISGGIPVFDISDPTLPRQVGNGDVPGSVVSINIKDNYGYVGTSNGFWVLDISNPVEPVPLTHLDLDYCTAAMGDCLAYLAGYDFYVIDISDPANPAIMGTCGIPSYGMGVSLKDDYAYVPASTYGLLIINISDSTQPFLESIYPTYGQAYGITISGDYGFLANSYNGLQVLDLYNPPAPVQVGYYDTPGNAGKVIFRDNLVYLDEGCFFGIYDVSAALPVNPWETTPSRPSSFVLYPPHPNPFNPTTVLTFDLPVAGLVKLEVFDINGRSVGAHSSAPAHGGGSTSALQYFPAGTHQIPFNGSGLPSGIYLARLTVEDPLGAGDFQQTLKMVLLK